MHTPSHRSRALGLSILAALLISGLSAAGAQGNWLLLFAGETKQLEANESIGLTAHTEFNLLVPAQGIEILCTTLAAEGLKILGLSTLGEGKMKFTSCKTRQKGKESPGCKPIEPIVAGGRAHLLLHAAKNYLLLEPTGGALGSFAIIQFNPATCALAEENELFGAVVAECGHLLVLKVEGGFAFDFVGLDCSKQESTHLFRQAASQALFEVSGLRFGISSATLDGIASASLNGAFFGVAWSGHV
jgi:hypothetical protein